ncbi:TetR/AcrR family transcriptional regulator [Nonomuraea maritima]|uniref:TetR/AcrR family transcriptional regulator n=1 Tax=Nonomuraea maritima TaxID=683260 RepID=UPI003721540B
MESLSERGAATRRRLLEAAAAELVETGDIEVAAVARRAGLSVGLPYRYFGTRSGLMSALLADFYERLVSETVLGHFAGHTWPERWRNQLTRWVDWVYDEPLAPVVLGRMVGDAQVAAMEADCAKQVIALGARHIATGQDEGAVTYRRDPELMSAAVVGGMRSILAVVLDQDPRPDRGAVLEEIWHFSTAALGVHGGGAALDVREEGAALDVREGSATRDMRREGVALSARDEETVGRVRHERGR